MSLGVSVTFENMEGNDLREDGRDKSNIWFNILLDGFAK